VGVLNSWTYSAAECAAGSACAGRLRGQRPVRCPCVLPARHSSRSSSWLLAACVLDATSFGRWNAQVWPCKRHSGPKRACVHDRRQAQAGCLPLGRHRAISCPLTAMTGWWTAVGGRCAMSSTSTVAHLSRVRRPPSIWMCGPRWTLWKLSWTGCACSWAGRQAGAGCAPPRCSAEMPATTYCYASAPPPSPLPPAPHTTPGCLGLKSWCWVWGGGE
jgi:hypothetical protein